MDADANILLTIYGEPQLTIDAMGMPAEAGGDARGEHNPAPVQRVGPVQNPLRVILAEDDVLLREGLATRTRGFRRRRAGWRRCTAARAGPPAHTRPGSDRHSDAADQHHRGARRVPGNPCAVPRHPHPGAASIIERPGRTIVLVDDNFGNAAKHDLTAAA
jgi:hypothetical protein